MDKKTYRRQAFRAALQVEFITTVRELRLYANAIYEALLWGKGDNNNDDEKANN